MTRRQIQNRSPLRHSRLRIVSFYLMTFIILLLPLAMGELVLRLCTSAPEVRSYDPYVSFSGLSPLFVPDSAGERLEIAAERLSAFRRQSFAAKKGRNTFRVFCLGGSTVQGRPYSVETSFTTWLGLSLSAARPEISYEIVNCGGISYASYRLVPVMRELLEYEPDLFIIYTGHNEFLEDRTYSRIKKSPRALLRLHRMMLSLRSYALAEQLLSRRRARRAGEESQSRTELSAEVRTKLDLVVVDDDDRVFLAIDHTAIGGAGIGDRVVVDQLVLATEVDGVGSVARVEDRTVGDVASFAALLGDQLDQLAGLDMRRVAHVEVHRSGGRRAGADRLR